MKHFSAFETAFAFTTALAALWDQDCGPLLLLEFCRFTVGTGQQLRCGGAWRPATIVGIGVMSVMLEILIPQCIQRANWTRDGPKF